MIDSLGILRLVAATCAVSVVPGALLTLLWKPRPSLTVLEIAGFGAAISFGLVQLLTMLAIALHLSPIVMLATLAFGCIAMVIVVVVRHPPKLVAPLDELLLLAVLVMFGVMLYRLGSPVDWFEDQVHAAIVRRLSVLSTPRLDNIYFAPGIVYTYPFPGTHYLMALIARLSDLDPLFVYQKLRFFWGPAALLMLYLLARAAFDSIGIACGTAMIAAALVFSGAFGMVQGFPSGWGQLMPFSHASDVAMTVLLPAAMVLACGYLLGMTSRERAFFLAGTVALVAMLTIVHIREVVQLTAYLGCFLVVTMAVRQFRPYMVRTAIVLTIVLAIAAIYTLWHAQVTSVVTEVVSAERAQLASVIGAASLRELLFVPAPQLLDEFVLNSSQLFVGLTPLFLFAGPAVLLLFRRQPVVWMLAASTAVYLVVMTVPLLAAAYIYLTYFEVLFTPVRNVIFFVYLFAGALIYSAVVALVRVDRTRVLFVIVAGTLAGALALLVALSINQTASGFVVPLIAGYAVAFLLSGELPAIATPKVRSIVALVVAGVGLVALWPQQTPAQRVTQVAVRWTADLTDAERANLEREFALTKGEPNSNRTADINVWNYELTNSAEENIRALVTHPRVVDTGGIERETFTVPPHPPSQDNPYVAVERVAFMQYPGSVLYAAAALFAWLVGFATPAFLASAPGRRFLAILDSQARRPFYAYIVPCALFMIPFAFWTARPTLSPFAESRATLPCLTTDARPAPYSEDLLNGEAVMLPERRSCPPSARVVDWIRTNVPADAVFAIDRWNPYLPSVFVPQQVVVYPQVEVTFENESDLFAFYYGFYDERIRADRVQPFFNSVETEAERAAFVERLGVTHVLVDPAYYEEMRSTLDRLPDAYRLRFTDGEWAVYEVVRPRARV